MIQNTLWSKGFCWNVLSIILWPKYNCAYGLKSKWKAANKCPAYVGTSRLLEQRQDAEFAKQQEQIDLLRIITHKCWK